MQIYIHIGYPKNASTTLQTDIFPNIDGAYYLGRHYINKSGYETQELSEALYDVTMQDSIEYSEERTKKKVEFTLNSISENFDKVIISSEAFSNNVADRGLIAQRLKSLFPQAKIMVVIRNQVDALKSMYSFLCAQLGKNINLSYGRPSVQSFEKWILEQEDFLPRSYIVTLKYYELILEYQSLFGKENVSTLLFEELSSSPDHFFSQIEDFMNVSICFNSGDKITPKRNKSPTGKALFYYKLRNKYPNIVPSKYLPNFMVEAWHKILFSGGKGSSSLVISSEIEDRILAFYRQSNKQLQVELDINIEDFGYIQ